MKFFLTLYKLVGFIVVRIILLFYNSRFSGQVFRSVNYKKSNAKVAVLAPGPGLLNFPGSEQFDIVISINLAAAYKDRIDFFLIERVDDSDFGRAQVSVVNHRKGVILLKNMWDQQSKKCIEKLNCKGVRFLVDVPLRISGFLSLKSVSTYMKLDFLGISNWKSSMFVAVAVAKRLGGKEIHVYGASGGNGYFWELDKDYIATYPLLESVVSQEVHPVRVGLNVDEVLKLVFQEDISKGRLVFHG